MLVVARHVTNQFEWAVHHPNAIKAGVARATLDLIEQGRDPVGMPEDEELVYDFCTELQQKMSVTDATYDRAVAALGEKAVAETIAIMGYYTYLAMFNNATRLPIGSTPAFTPATR